MDVAEALEKDEQRAERAKQLSRRQVNENTVADETLLSTCPVRKASGTTST